MTYSFKLLLAVVVAAAVIGSSIRFSMKSSSSGGLRRGLQRNFGNFSNSGTGISQILISAGNGPSSATGTGAGTGASFTGASFGNLTAQNIGQSQGLASVAGLAFYGDLAADSLSTGYSTGFGGFASIPGANITIPGTPGSSGGKGKGSKGSKSGSSGTPSTIIPGPATITSFTGGSSGGLSIGNLLGVGAFTNGANFGTFAGQSIGSTGIPGNLVLGGSESSGGQEGSGYAFNGGFQIQNLGSGFSSFFNQLAGLP